MVTRAQIDRLAQRVEALGSSRHSERIVVLGPDETEKEALRRDGVRDRAAYHRIIFIRTGVPRSPQWLQGSRSKA